MTASAFEAVALTEPVRAASPFVDGLHEATVTAAAWMRVVWLAFRVYKNPRLAMSVLRRMIAARSSSYRFTTRKYARHSGRYFWNLYSPGFPSPAFDRFVEREMDRVEPFREKLPALHMVIVAITKRCALQCEHCYEGSSINDRESLSCGDLIEIVERLRVRGIAQIFFSGGEPLLRFDDLLRLVAHAASDADVWILTSGHGLTAERAMLLRSAGLTGVAISLDHWDAASHDRFRGFDGAHRWAEKAAVHARAAGLVVALSLCPTRAFVSRENLDRYANVARDLGATFIQIVEPMAVGRYRSADVSLSGSQQTLLEEFARGLDGDAYRDFPVVAYPERTRRAAPCNGAGDRFLYIDTDGSLQPCPFCHAPPRSALEGDFDAAVAALRESGCPRDRNVDRAAWR